MATLIVDGTDLEVRLSALEKLGAFSGTVRVPLAHVVAVRVTNEPYAELKGMRVGTGIPWVIVLGRMIYPGGKDFVAIYGTGRTVVVDLAPSEAYRRILVSTDDARIAEEIAARIDRRA